MCIGETRLAEPVSGIVGLVAVSVGDELLTKILRDKPRSSISDKKDMVF